MKITRIVSILFLTLVIGLSALLSGCSIGKVNERIKTTPQKSIIQGEGRYEYKIIIRGKNGKLHMYPISIPYPQVERQKKEVKNEK